MQGVNFIFLIAILILSVVAHGSHGFVAYLLWRPYGLKGRKVSRNPLKHLI